jgi:hypothetical protein
MLEDRPPSLMVPVSSIHNEESDLRWKKIGLCLILRRICIFRT